ncbi:hypothetical protein F0160_36855 [Paraburkholderia sp. JPY303]|uniref:hypothetical protein n=1 Tax=Paraburkholderia atlantica TaxID=2654982 RepID=UPI0015920FBF|nr:hypothetical protein [Paraburkholderia atlantica]NUY35901.1 hypothetical protein [Paraburkholderia atlantica]
MANETRPNSVEEMRKWMDIVARGFNNDAVQGKDAHDQMEDQMGDQIGLKLVPSDEEDQGQAGYKKFFGQVSDAGGSISAIDSIAMESAGALHHLLSGTFVIPLAQVAGPIVSAAAVAWFQGRAGRKMRLKVGDVEVEARTPEEVEQLLSAVRTLQTDQKKSSDDA